jgi:ADP-ribose pyrophosphatase YjhB (NUDIX family)
MARAFIAVRFMFKFNPLSTTVSHTTIRNISSRGPVTNRVPPGDTKMRLVCDDCGFILYDNPKNIVGALTVTSDGRVLLARRAIMPRKGLWGIPAGFMELGETLSGGALRELSEEVDAQVIGSPQLLAVYSVAAHSQVHFYLRAFLDELRVASTTPADGADVTFFGRGQETMETRLFAPSEIPWNELAFPITESALKFHLAHPMARASSSDTAVSLGPVDIQEFTPYVK